MQHTLETDFLVVGAGAMGLAFTDEILSADTAARVVMVDRRAGPGGHWNDAYDFVRLHQPAAYYGVNSARLGSGRADDLASKPEILAYFQRVVARWVGTGRLRFLPQCEMGEDGVVRSLVGDETWRIEAARAVVDGTFSQVQVPATHGPAYAVSPDASLVPVGGLWRLPARHPQYVVIGAGKTGFDAILYLLERGVDAGRITWIVSRDSWLYARAGLHPKVAGTATLSHLRIVTESRYPDEAFARMERDGWWLRVDEARTPTMFRCATVSRDELHGLRRIDDVVRMGRVQRVEPDRLVLDGGELPVKAGALFVDCTADGLARRAPVPVFAGRRITLQPLFFCQQVASAAAIAALLRRLPDDDALRNSYAVAVPHPDVPEDYIRCISTTLDNLMRWGDQPGLGWWALRSRLSATHHLSWWRQVQLITALSRSGPAIQARLHEIVAGLDRKGP